MAKKNRTICIVLKNDVEYFEEHEGSYFRQLVKDNGMIGTGKKAVQCTHAWLVEGSGAVLADWHKAFVIENTFLPPINMSQEEFAAIVTAPAKAIMNPSQTEDPVERIKRKAKARIAPADDAINGDLESAMTKAKKIAVRHPQTIEGEWPAPQPWVEPEELSL